MKSETVEKMPGEEANSSSGWKIQLGVLGSMILLALIGMGLTQAAQERGVWEYWLFVIIVYAGLGLWRSTRKAKQAGKPVKQLVAREMGHWCTLLAFIGIVLLLERKEIIDRESTSDISLMLLALTCCLAGIHFDWLLTVIGVVLTIMLVALATLEQYTLVLWVVMILVSAGAVAFLYFRAKNRPESENRALRMIGILVYRAVNNEN